MVIGFSNAINRLGIFQALSLFFLGVIIDHLYVMKFSNENLRSILLQGEKESSMKKYTLRPSHSVASNTLLQPPSTNETHIVIAKAAGGNGGMARIPVGAIQSAFRNPLTQGIKDDLLAFTGLSEPELMDRLKRNNQHHFKVEHRFFDPKSTAELALYYRSSTAYIWANAIHPALDLGKLNMTASSDGPALDYSGGVGSVCIALAKKGIKAVYFGIGLMEFEFAQFRALRQNLSHMITFVKPYSWTSRTGGYGFDPVHSLELKKTLPEKLGAIFALDVFEHIPSYHVTARHLVSLLRHKGKLFENSPFASKEITKTSIHLKASMPMSEALHGMNYGGRMNTNPPVNMWIKTGYTYEKV